MKRQWKRTLSIILSATLLTGMTGMNTAFAAEESRLYVGSVDIIAAEDHTVTCGGGSAVYDPATATLTLTDAEITAVNHTGYGIYAEYLDELSIVLEGENTIDGADIHSGVHVFGELSLSGSGTLNITTRPSAADIAAFGLSGWGGVTIEDTTVKVTNTGSTYAYGIDSNGETAHCTITNSTVEIDGCDVGINVPSNNITISGSELFINDVIAGVNGGSGGGSALTFSGSRLTVTGLRVDPVDSRSCALSGKDITLDHTALIAKADSSFTTGNVVNSATGITVINGSELELQSGWPALRAGTGITIESSTVNAVSTQSNGIYTPGALAISGDSDVTADGADPGLYAGTAITISGGTVRSTGKNGIYTDGVLTIGDTAGVTATGTAWCGLNAAAGIVIRGGTVVAVSPNDCAIYSPAAIIIDGDSDVTAQGYFAGIQGDGGLAIVGGTVVSTSTDDCGIFSPEAISIGGESTVTADGLCGIRSNNNITISSAADVTATGTGENMGPGSVLGFGLSSDGTLSVRGGTVRLSGAHKATSAAPNLADYPDAAVTAGEHSDGSSTGDYDPTQWESYKYIKIAPPQVPVAGITLSQASAALYSNTSPREVTLTVSVSPENATDKTVTWTSSDDGVATVSGGVVTAEANGTATITATANDGSGISAACTVTVSTYSSGGSSSGGGTITAIPPAPGKPDTAAHAETKVTPTVDADGSATVTVPEKSVTDVIKAAQDAAKKAGTEKNGVSVTIDATTNKGASGITATLTANSVDALIKAGVTQIQIKADAATITLDLAALKAAQAVAGGAITVSAKPVAVNTLSASAQQAIGNRPVFGFTLQSGGKPVSDFGGGSASLSIPYAPQAGEDTGRLCVVYVDDNGGVTYLTDSSYDPNTKAMIARTGHFSVYGVGYKQDAPVFTDTANHWAKADIDFVAARGLLSGTGNNQFSPNTGMTRGMFVTALGRLAGIDPASYKTGTFTDVSADAYYAPYVAWAADKGIVSGTTATTFAPDSNISREQMAVIMANYAKALGYAVPKTREAVTFADGASTASWARDAVKAMQMAGILNGKGANRFDPQGAATRAEGAAVLRRYVELVVDPATAQGME